MTAQSVPSLLILAVCLVLAGFLVVRGRSLDFAGPLRVWLWKRDAERMAQRNRFPATVQRAYWSEREYRLDSPRLMALGYRVQSQERWGPYVETPAFGQNAPPFRRRIPALFVVYGRAGENGDPPSAAA